VHAITATGPVVVRGLRPGAGSRAVIGLTPRDEAAYRRLVARVAPAVEARLAPCVLANRLSSRGPSMLRPWPPDRRRWAAIIGRALARSRPTTFAVSDVADFYPSVTIRAMIAGLATAGADPEAVEDVRRFIDSLRTLGVRGLPVGPEASAILANAVLLGADGAVEAEGVTWMRWVDDLVVMAPEPATAARALGAWSRALGAAGLELRQDKTRLMTDLDEVCAVLAGRPSRAAGPARGIIATT
jgi:Reverse transcriptase (RNA-dependent DNA polymerase)